MSLPCEHTGGIKSFYFYAITEGPYFLAFSVCPEAE